MIEEQPDIDAHICPGDIAVIIASWLVLEAKLDSSLSDIRSNFSNLHTHCTVAALHLVAGIVHESQRRHSFLVHSPSIGIWDRTSGEFESALPVHLLYQVLSGFLMRVAGLCWDHSY